MVLDSKENKTRSDTNEWEQFNILHTTPEIEGFNQLIYYILN